MREADGGSPHASPARKHSVWQKVPDHPISYAGTSLPPYSPFTPFSPKLVTVTVSATRACAVEVAFLAPGVPAKLSGAGSLNYDVQQSSATTSLLFTGAFPVATAHIDIGAEAKPLASFRTYRQLSGWNPPPLMIRAFGAHCQYRSWTDDAVIDHRWHDTTVPPPGTGQSVATANTPAAPLTASRLFIEWRTSERPLGEAKNHLTEALSPCPRI